MDQYRLLNASTQQLNQNMDGVVYLQPTADNIVDEASGRKSNLPIVPSETLMIVTKEIRRKGCLLLLIWRWTYRHLVFPLCFQFQIDNSPAR